MKDIKIESLESILKRREAQANDNTNQVVNQLEERIRSLESDREKLIKDNVSLIRQIEHYKEDYER